MSDTDIMVSSESGPALQQSTSVGDGWDSAEAQDDINDLFAGPSDSSEEHKVRLEAFEEEKCGWEADTKAWRADKQAWAAEKRIWEAEKKHLAFRYAVNVEGYAEADEFQRQIMKAKEDTWEMICDGSVGIWIPHAADTIAY